MPMEEAAATTPGRKTATPRKTSDSASVAAAQKTAPQKTAAPRKTAGAARPKKAAAEKAAAGSELTRGPAAGRESVLRPLAEAEPSAPPVAAHTGVAPEPPTWPLAAPQGDAAAQATGRTPAAPSARTPGQDLRSTAARVLDHHPGFAPELLALAAVRALGPSARDWVAWHLAAYPDATADGLARLATRRFVRLAGAGGAGAALAGVLAPVAELAAVLWTQANLVLHLAAAYGRDPLDRDRAVELLVLTRVHPDAESARSALGVAGRRAAPESSLGHGRSRRLGGWPRRWRRRPAAGWGSGWRRGWCRGGGAGRGGGDSAAAARLAARAVAAYRPSPARSIGQAG
ncbi:hypothetical protein [Micromonospora olivasterospora]|uniref:Uncharacterized protein n=1 Tax=Micromonospora olivasterospora TaxID=1880 RepID=A0A562I8G6_MICOL|nr:hypothetical protein [Micromonospora olivasterospora]TWH67289.1 hypothetical protein JD77_02263 [Micromonospora olivasterospora]